MDGLDQSLHVGRSIPYQTKMKISAIQISFRWAPLMNLDLDLLSLCFSRIFVIENPNYLK